MLEAPPAKSLHLLYVAAEAAKLLLLLATGSRAYIVLNGQPQPRARLLQYA